MDIKIFYLIFNIGKNNPSIYNCARFLENHTSIFFTLIYLFFCTYTYLSNIQNLILFITLPILVLVISKILKKIIARQRPFKILNLYINKRETSYSFPSNHACSMTIISTIVYTALPILGIILFIVSFLTCISKIILGLHYPSDILFGCILSIIFKIIFL